MTRAVATSSSPLAPWQRTSEEADKKAKRCKVVADAEEAIRKAIEELKQVTKEIVE